jgi:hypothetical protein
MFLSQKLLALKGKELINSYQIKGTVKKILNFCQILTLPKPIKPYHLNRILILCPVPLMLIKN